MAASTIGGRHGKQTVSTRSVGVVSLVHAPFPEVQEILCWRPLVVQARAARHGIARVVPRESAEFLTGRIGSWQNELTSIATPEARSGLAQQHCPIESSPKTRCDAADGDVVLPGNEPPESPAFSRNLFLTAAPQRSSGVATGCKTRRHLSAAGPRLPATRWSNFSQKRVPASVAPHSSAQSIRALARA